MARSEDLVIPANKIVAVTQSDTVADPGGPFRGLLLTVAGTIRLQMANGTVNLLSGTLAPGVIHPVRFTRIHVTGTTATGIFGVRDETR